MSSPARTRMVRTDQRPRQCRPHRAGLQRLSRRAGTPRSPPASCRSTTSSSRPNRWATAPTTVLTSDIAVADSKFVVNYWRLSEDNRLLFGGGESYGYRFPRDIAAAVRKPMLSIYPHLNDVQDRLCLGRHAGDHPHPDARFRAPAHRALVGLGLFRPRRRAGDAGRQADRRRDPRRQRRLRRHGPRPPRAPFPARARCAARC